MSYSRWSNSEWYTYADVHGGFTICGVANYSADRLRNEWAQIKEELHAKGYLEDELDELKTYVDMYLRDEEKRA